MAVSSAVFLAALQLAVAEIGEWLWLLEAGLAPKPPRAFDCLCAFSQKLQPVQQEQQQGTWINIGGEDTGQVWEPRSLVVFLFLSATGAESLEQGLGSE